MLTERFGAVQQKQAVPADCTMFTLGRVITLKLQPRNFRLGDVVIGYIR